MMAACPNCRSQVNDDQMFCRACGFRLEVGFQISTQKLGLPSVARLPLSKSSSSYGPQQCVSWRYHMLPIAGFLLALLLGGFTAALFNNEPAQINTYPSASAPAERSFMGVYLVADGSAGVIIDRVVEASPAELAGVRSGDVILAINDFEVNNPNDVVAKLSAIAPGTAIKVKIERGGEELYAPMTTVRRNELQVGTVCHHEGFLGVGSLQTTETVGDDGEHSLVDGVQVGTVMEDSPAERAGLQAGDIIISIDDARTSSPEELSRRVRAVTPDNSVAIQIVRDGDEMTLVTTMGRR